MAERVEAVGAVAFDLGGCERGRPGVVLVVGASEGPAVPVGEDQRCRVGSPVRIAPGKRDLGRRVDPQVLGERPRSRPSGIRPDAQAAFDHAQAQTDRYLARHLDELTPEQLAELDARQQAIITRRPAFDPAELETARRTHDEAVRSGEPTTGPRVAARVALLERQARPTDAGDTPPSKLQRCADRSRSPKRGRPPVEHADA
jgi:hypothetical protein